MTLSYLQASLDKIKDAVRDDVIEICINPDGSCWGEFQGDHFMSPLDQHMSVTDVRDLGNQIASNANTTMSKDKPIVSVSIIYRDRSIRAQVVTPPAVLSGMSISLRFFSNLPLGAIELRYLYGKERKLEELRQEKNRALREVVASGDIYAAVAFCVENKLNMIVSGGTSTGKTVAARINMEIDPKRYEEIAADIHSDTSPVGIDAKKTHILILHMLQQLEARLERIEKQVDELNSNR